MQYSRPASFVPFSSSFQNHRASLDQSKLRVDLRLSKPPPLPVWASLPTPPMSGTPPPELPPDVPQIAGRRRKRSETPPAAPAVSNAAPPTPIEHSLAVNRAQAQPAPPSNLILDPSSQLPSYPSNYPPPIPTGCGVSSSISIIANSPVDASFAPGQSSPRTTRKTKAHVASACVNCKKKHLRCDSARPCRRCVQSGKEDSCKDVEHKKRGRPPLRPDEPSRRAFDPTLHPLARQTADPSRRMPTADPSTFTHSAHPRSFRPLQAQPAYDSGRTHMRPPSAYPLYAQPSISPSQATAIGSFTPSSRPFIGSSYQGMQAATGYPSPYQYLAPQEPVSISQQQYANPIFPREPLPPPPQTQTMGYGASLQLPPILPAPERSLIDPALAQQPPAQQNPQQHPQQQHLQQQHHPQQQHPQQQHPQQQQQQQQQQQYSQHHPQQQQQHQQQQYSQQHHSQHLHPQQHQPQQHHPQQQHSHQQHSQQQHHHHRHHHHPPQAQHHGLSHGHPSPGDGTAQPDPKRPKMDIQGILGPRHD